MSSHPNRSKHKSIGGRLRSAKTRPRRREILTEWRHNWYDDQMDIVAQLERAIGRMDYDALCIATGQLRAVTEKRFLGLDSVIRRLTEDPDDAAET